MKLMAYNILEGGEGRIDPLAEVIRLADPDVVMAEFTEHSKMADTASELLRDYVWEGDSLSAACH